MPKPIPFPIGPKAQPQGTELTQETPVETAPVQTIPNESPPNINEPNVSPAIEETPDETPKLEEMPEHSQPKVELPPNVDPENCIILNGKVFEVKPTKLKYFRNKAAAGYGIIKSVPIHELLTIGKGVVDEKRDADMLLFDFLIAAFDDVDFVRDNYDEMTADDVEKVIKIFGRLNHIDEKEEQARKNREAQAKR